MDQQHQQQPYNDGYNPPIDMIDIRDQQTVGSNPDEFDLEEMIGGGRSVNGYLQSPNGDIEIGGGGGGRRGGIERSRSSRSSYRANKHTPSRVSRSKSGAYQTSKSNSTRSGSRSIDFAGGVVNNSLSSNNSSRSGARSINYGGGGGRSVQQHDAPESPPHRQERRPSMQSTRSNLSRQHQQLERRPSMRSQRRSPSRSPPPPQSSRRRGSMRSTRSNNIRY
mmetsp:Transcript_50713/g.57423  ORF Transcript_50713/g.57423 Transcript_50713/m.57423 type:complete len:222 (+) Transcript_50713:2-667(+)